MQIIENFVDINGKLAGSRQGAERTCQKSVCLLEILHLRDTFSPVIIFCKIFLTNWFEPGKGIGTSSAFFPLWSRWDPACCIWLAGDSPRDESQSQCSRFEQLNLDRKMDLNPFRVTKFTFYENGRPYCRYCPGHPALGNSVQNWDVLVNNSVDLYSLPNPVEYKRLLYEVVSCSHHNCSTVEGGSKYCETFLKKKNT